MRELGRSGTRRSGRKRLLPPLAAALLLAAACSSDATGPTPPPPPPPEAPKPVPPLPNAVDLADMILDLSDRVVPGLPEGQANADLLRTLGLLRAAVINAGGDGKLIPQVRGALTDVGVVISLEAVLTVGDPGAEADLDVVRLSMEVLWTAVGN